MKAFIPTLFLFFSSTVTAVPFNLVCDIDGPTLDIPIRKILSIQLGIDESSLNLQKTEMELLSRTKVLPALATQLTQRDQLARSYIGSIDEGWDNNFNIYADGDVENLVVKYSFYNKENKKNVFIGSTIMNDGDCSAAFTGFITVSREF